MDIRVFDSQELGTVFQVLRTALNPGQSLAPHERVFLQTYAKITDFALPAQDPPVVRPQDVRIAGAHQRKRLIQLAAIAALLSNPVKKESVSFIRELAQELATSEPVLAVLEALVKGQRLKARLLTARRGLGVMVSEARLAEGIPGVLRFAGALLFRTTVNRDKVWDYKRLGLLPEGTLGREYWKHLTELGFGFPGEPAGIPDSTAYHDVAHVLADNDTTPLGEIQQGSFQGGNRRADGFFFIQFVLLQFHHGLQITPVAPPEVGQFDPAKVLWAIHRGAACPVDFTHQWNFWPLMQLPLAEARARCGLLPKLAQ